MPKNVITLVIGIGIAAVTAYFAFQNSDPMNVRFYKWEFQSIEAVILLLAVAIGVLITILTFLPSRMIRTMKIAGLKSKVKKLEKELEKAKIECQTTNEAKTQKEKELEDLNKKKAKEAEGIEEIAAE